MISHQRSIAFLFVVVFAAGCGGSSDTADTPDVQDPPRSTEVQERADEPIVGVEIHETDRDLQELFEEWRTLGVNTVFAGEELTSSGGFRALAKKNATDLFIVFPVFFAPGALAENPDLWAVTSSGEKAKAGRVEFVCPSRADFRDRRVEEARAIVKRLRPEGLSIDLLSQFMFWGAWGLDGEAAAPPDTCYCVHCLQAFAIFLRVPTFSIPPQPQRAAAWVQANAADEWVRFKAQTITSMAEEIADEVQEIDPDILINIGVMPWRGNDSDGTVARFAGQNVMALSKIADSLSPMAFSFMLERPPEWVASVVQDFERVTACPVLPSIQVSPTNPEGGDISGAELEAALRSALELPSTGVILRTWDDIEADPDKAEIIRRVLLGQ